VKPPTILKWEASHLKREPVGLASGLEGDCCDHHCLLYGEIARFTGVSCSAALKLPLGSIIMLAYLTVMGIRAICAEG
jgi:hypothetical protein